MYPDESNLTTVQALKDWLDPPITATGLGAIAVTNGGNGYTVPPLVTITGGGGNGALATAIVVGGVVTAIVLTNHGTGYISIPAIGFTGGGGGANAAATATLSADALLQRLINAVSAAIVSLLNIAIVFDSGANITERRNGTGQQRMAMKVTPIVSVSSVSVISQSGPAVVPAYDGTSSGYLVDGNSIYLLGYAFVRGVQNVTVVYRAGSVLGSQVQAQLEQCALTTCALWWKRRAHIDQRSEMAPSGIGTLSFLQDDFPMEVLTIINSLKRIAPVGP